MTDYITRVDDQGNSRALSGLVWRNCAQIPIIQSPGSGKYFEDDFMSFVADVYTTTPATSGTFTGKSGAEGGVAVLDPGDPTAGQGPNVQVVTAGVACKPTSVVYHETILTPETITNGINLFVGLSEVETAIIAASAIAASSYVGFYAVGSDGSISFGSSKAGVSQVFDDLGNLEAGTQIRLGFRVDTAGTVSAYINGSLVATVRDAQYIPDVVLVPSLVNQAKGTQNVVDVDYFSTFQDDS